MASVSPAATERLTSCKTETSKVPSLNLRLMCCASKTVGLFMLSKLEGLLIAQSLSRLDATGAPTGVNSRHKRQG